jgi:hypothetical protein
LTGTNKLLTDLTGSIHITNDLIHQILRSQIRQDHKASLFHAFVIQQINLQLKSAQPIDRQLPDLKQYGNEIEHLAVERKVYRRESFLGALELAFGSPTQLNFARAGRIMNGLASRLTYVPPPWFFRMAISISAAFVKFPRLEFNFGIRYVAEVPWESDILTFAQVGDMDGLVKLIRTGKAAATDRDSRGNTALHASIPLPLPFSHKS